MQDYQLRPLNRGMKLRINSFLPKPTLLSPLNQQEYINLGKKRALIKQQQNSEDPYMLIQVEEIWKVWDSFQDIRTSSIRNSFKSRYPFIKKRHTQLLSAELMKIVHEVYPFLVCLIQMSKSMANNQTNNTTEIQQLQVNTLVPITFNLGTEVDYPGIFGKDSRYSKTVD